MVAHLMRLKLALLRNSFRRSPWQLVGVCIGGLYGLGMVVFAVTGTALLADADAALANTILVCAASLVTLGWAIVPLVAFGVDLTLDPARFTTFTISRPRLATGLLLSGFIGVPGLLTLLLLGGQFLAWRRDPPALLAALAGGVAGALMCLALARLTTTSMARLTGSRRFRDVAGIIAIIPLILLGPIIGTAAEGIESVLDWLPRLATVLGFTPLGVFAALPGDLAAGAWGLGAARLVLGLAYLGAVLWAWERGLHKSMENPLAPHTGSKPVGMGAFGIFPATPRGAVAARALTYWLKDPRYAASIVVVPLMPVLIWFTSTNSGNPQLMLVLGPLLGILMAFAISADVSYDSTAFSLHVLTGVRGVDDRAGRVLACAVFALPVTLLAAILPPVFLGRTDLLPAILGISLCGLLSGFGVASVASARFTYAVPLPGESPFKTPPGAGARMAVVQLATFAIMSVLLLPALGLLVAQVLTHHAIFGWLALAVGVVEGAVLLVAGIRLGGRWLDARAPELMQAVAANR
ncbi:transporter [Paeniglutamicibacter psychrophenolicus]|uniref:transporter n=1 Tax=Paeniglutamicibacter psychrophenolicus TaxID=257454 RepID=UPI0027872CA5|nr:transporter [Paeniglutamicibacter psychrophenolicus]MDQ0095844.1 ABC-2 type transport system permease protein [Paeniglutamicibacter psychrophenolicus]